MHSGKIGRATRIAPWILLVVGMMALFCRLEPVSAADACSSLAGDTVQWIVPHSVGGGYDTYSRLIAPFLEKRLDAEIVVHNTSGAGGTIGAAAIHDAAPDGRTIGILNGSGLMVKALAGGEKTPNPATDFTILARIVKNQQVWAVAADSPFQSMEDLFNESRKRPILFGMRDVGSTSFINVAVASHLLGMPMDIVAGYKGTQAKTLAAIRGEVDCVVSTFETIQSHIESGELHPVLQVAVEPIVSHPSLEHIPLLGGPEGLAARRALEFEQDVEQAVTDAAGLVGLIGAGRLVVAPPGIATELSGCLEQAVLDVLRDPAFETAATKAGRTLDVGTGSMAQAELTAVEKTAVRFIPIIQDAIAKARH